MPRQFDMNGDLEEEFPHYSRRSSLHGRQSRYVEAEVRSLMEEELWENLDPSLPSSSEMRNQKP